MLSHRVAMVRGEHYQRVVRVRRVFQSVEDPACRRVDHFQLPVVAPNVVLPQPLAPVLGEVRLGAPHVGDEELRLAGIEAEIAGQRRQPAFDLRIGKPLRRMEVEFRPVDQHVDPLANVVRIHQPGHEEKRVAAGRAVVQQGLARPGRGRVAVVADGAPFVKDVETAADLAAGDVPFAHVKRRITGAVEPGAQVGNLGPHAKPQVVEQHAVLGRGPAGEPAGTGGTAQRVGTVRKLERGAAAGQTIEIRRLDLRAAELRQREDAQLIDVDEKDVRGPVSRRRGGRPRGRAPVHAAAAPSAVPLRNVRRPIAPCPRSSSSRRRWFRRIMGSAPPRCCARSTPGTRGRQTTAGAGRRASSAWATCRGRRDRSPTAPRRCLPG